jgi:hypothetical protein
MKKLPKTSIGWFIEWYKPKLNKKDKKWNSKYQRRLERARRNYKV